MGLGLGLGLGQFCPLLADGKKRGTISRTISCADSQYHVKVVLLETIGHSCW